MSATETPTFKKSDLTRFAKSIAAAHIIQKKWSEREEVPLQHRVEYLQMMQQFLDVLRIISVHRDRKFITSIEGVNEGLLEKTREMFIEVLKEVSARSGNEVPGDDTVPEVLLDHDDLTFEDRQAMDEILARIPFIEITED